MGKAKNPPKQASNEARAVLRMYRSSPQKLNLLAQQIRGLPVERALAELQFSPKRPAKDVASFCRAPSRTQRTTTTSTSTAWSLLRPTLARTW